LIISPDIQGQVDGSVQKHILAHLPELPVDIVPISWFPNFHFTPPKTSKYVLIDFMEPHEPRMAYDSFWEWVSQNPPVLTFRRELAASERSETLVPIEWTCHLPIPDAVSKAEFDSRPIELLFNWGYSNPSRPKLHGDIFREGMAKHGINVLSEWEQYKETMLNQSSYRLNLWLSIFTPHWKRRPMAEILPFIQKSKITVALPGNGKKTFRHSECVGTIMSTHSDSLAWAYPWTKENSIQLIPEFEFQSLLEATKRTDLYDLYVSCDSNMRKYEEHAYVRDYVLKEIEKVL